MEIFLSAKADKQLSKLPHPMHQLMISEIEKLAANPTPPNSRKLVNRHGWRIRVGIYRILYAFDLKKKESTILSVAHRRDAYRMN